MFTSSPRHQVALPQGTVRYIDTGTGPTLVFIHGLLTNGGVWHKVIPALAGSFRCIAPDLPLGGHTAALAPLADLTPPGLAQLIADFLDVLDLRDITLIGNDTGGALVQLVLTRHPQRLGRVILINCDAYENFLPPALRPFQYGAHVPGMVPLVAAALRLPVFQRLMLAPVSRAPFDPALAAASFSGLQQSEGVRHDLGKVLRGISTRYTVEAAHAFGQFPRPVLLVWGTRDLFFPLRDAERLQKAFPDATLVTVDNSRTFIQLDQPQRLIQHILDFMRHGQPEPTATTKPV